MLLYFYVFRYNGFARMRLVKTVLLLSSSMTVMAGSVISPALPEISRHFSPEGPTVLTKLILTMPAIMIAVCAPLAGHLSDIFGRKELLLVSLVLYGAAGLSGYFLDNLILLLVSRALLGVGVGGIMSAATALIGDLFSGRERAGFIGVQSGFMYIGGVVLVLFGGMLAEISWNAPFAAYAAAFVIFLLGLLGLPDPEKREKRKHDAKHNNDAFPYAPFVLIYGLVFLLMIFYFMVLVQVPFLLQGRFGAGSIMTGILIAVSAMAGSLSSLSYSSIKRRLSYRTIYMLGFGFIAAGFALIGVSGSLPLMLTGLACAGLGNGLLMPNGSFWLMELAPEHQRGKAVGGYTGMIFLGQFCSPLVMAPVVTYATLSGAFFVASAAMVLIVVFLLRITE